MGTLLLYTATLIPRSQNQQLGNGKKDLVGAHRSKKEWQRTGMEKKLCLAEEIHV